MSKSLPPADDKEEPGRQIEDEDNASQSATIRRIQSYRDDIADYQLLFAQNELSENISEAQQHRAYFQLAKGFLQLLRPYLSDEDVPQSTHYWNEVALGEFAVDPPAAIAQPSQQQLEHALKASDQSTISRADPRNSVDSKHFSVIGLRDFASAQAEWDVQWEVMFGPDVSAADIRSQLQQSGVRVSPGTHRNEPLTVTKRVRIPRQIIDNAVTELENFVRDIGMDVEWDEEEQQTKIDRDLLEEVDEWRQQNVK